MRTHPASCTIKLKLSCLWATSCSTKEQFFEGLLLRETCPWWVSKVQYKAWLGMFHFPVSQHVFTPVQRQGKDNCTSSYNALCFKKEAVADM